MCDWHIGFKVAESKAAGLLLLSYRVRAAGSCTLALVAGEPGESETA